MPSSSQFLQQNLSLTDFGHEQKEDRKYAFLVLVSQEELLTLSHSNDIYPRALSFSSIVTMVTLNTQCD